MADRQLKIDILIDASGAVIALDTLDKKMAQLSDRSLAKVSAGVSTVDQELKKVQQSFDKTADAAGRTNVATANLLTTVGKFVSAAAIIGAAKHTLDFADNLEKMAERAGIGVEKFQLLSGAAKIQNVEMTKLTTAVQQLQDRLGSDDKNAIAAVKKLGLSWQMLKNASPDVLIESVADAVGKLTDHNVAVSVLNDLFGRQGKELLPLVNGRLRELEDQVQKTSGVLSKDMVKALSDVHDQMELLTAKGEVLLGKALTPIASAFMALPDAAQIASLGMAGLLATFGTLSGSATALYGTLMALAANPVALAILGVGAAAGLSVYGYNRMMTQAQASMGPGNIGAPLDARHALSLDDPKVQAAFAGPGLGSSLQLNNDALPQKMAKHTGSLRVQADLAERQARAFDKILSDINAFEAGDKINGRMTPWGVPVTGWNPSMENPALSGIVDWNTLMAQQGQAAMPSGRMTPFGVPTDLNAEQSFFGMGGAPKPGGLSSFFGSFTQGLPTVIMQALTGGGHLGQSIGGLAGSGLSSALGLGVKGATGFAGSALGSILGGVLPGIGALIGPLLGKLFGPSKGQIEGQKADQQIGQLQQQLTDTYGSFQNLDKIGKLVGVDIGAAWGDKNVQGLAHFKGMVEDFNAKLAETNRQFQAVTANGGVASNTLLAVVGAQAKAGGQVGDNARQMLGQFITSNVNQTQSGLQKLAGAGLDFTAGGASAVGASTMALIGQMQALGMSTNEILKTLGPTIESLSQQFAKLGVDGGAAFADINAQIAFLSDKTVASTVDGIDGLTQMMVGLGNLGDLTSEQFSGLTEQIGASYNKLIAQGKDGGRALRAIQPDLQKLWELEQKFGFKADDATQALIDQGVQAGIVGDNFRSDTDKMTAAIDKLIGKMGDLINAILGIVPASQAASDAIGNIPTPGQGSTQPRSDQTHGGGGANNSGPGPRPPGYPTNLPWPPVGSPGAALGGYVTDSGIQYLSGGGFAGYWNERMVRFTPKGTDTVAAMLTPGEVVIPAPVVAAAGGARQTMSLVKSAPLGTLVKGGSFTGPAAHPGDSQVRYDPDPNKRGGTFTINVSVPPGTPDPKRFGNDVGDSIAKTLTSKLMSNDLTARTLAGAMSLTQRRQAGR